MRTCPRCNGEMKRKAGLIPKSCCYCRLGIKRPPLTRGQNIRVPAQRDTTADDRLSVLAERAAQNRPLFDGSERA